MSPEKIQAINTLRTCLRDDKRTLIAEFSERLHEIVTQERMLATAMGEDYIEPPKTEEYYGSMLLLGNATMAQAAEWALRRIGAPARMPQVVTLLQSYGFHPDDERNRLGNTIFKSMDRSSLFVRNGDLTWGLAEWQHNPKKGE